MNTCIDKPNKSSNNPQSLTEKPKKKNSNKPDTSKVENDNNKIEEYQTRTEYKDNKVIIIDSIILSKSPFCSKKIKSFTYKN